MREAWIVVRSEKHFDDKYWVCCTKDDALRIAQDVTAYWRSEYYNQDRDIDEELHSDLVYHYDMEDCFRVHVEPVSLYEPGDVIRLEDT